MRKTSITSKFLSIMVSVTLVLGLNPGLAFAEPQTSGESAQDTLASQSFESISEQCSEGLTTMDAALESDGGSELPIVPIVDPSIVASGTCGADGDNLKWSLNNSGVLAITGSGAMADFSYVNYPSESTDIPWFSYRSQITSVTIAEGATSVGEYAFFECTNLATVSNPSTLTTIGKFACKSCSSLTSVNIPTSVATLGLDVFSNCTKLKTAGPTGSGCNIVFGWTQELPANAFRGCTALETITLPDTMTTIGDYAFNNCSSLSSVNIPAGVTSIGFIVYNGCTQLKTAGPTGSGCNIEFGWTQALPDAAFANCSSLTSITLPDTIVSIGDTAFQSCSSLSSVNIPAGVTSIGFTIYSGCTQLKTAGPTGSGCNIEFGWTQALPEDAFANCTSLTSITLPDTIVSIGDTAFSSCSSLTSIVLPASLKSIDTWAFRSCSSLSKITFMGDAPTFGSWVFSDVTAEAYYPANNTTWTESVRQDYDGDITWIAYGEDFKIDMSNMSVASIENQSFTGKEIKPEPTVTFNGTTLTKGTDYKFSYTNNINAGTATVTITGIGDYCGTKQVNFTIDGLSIVNATVASIANQTFTGSEIKPEPAVTLNGTTLTKGTDYELSYANNTNVGTATVTITGKGNYSGTKQAVFTIVAASIANATVASIANQTFTGSEIKPEPAVTLNGTTLKAGTDYELSYANNTNVGTATVTVTGKGNYTGAKQVQFTIVQASTTAYFEVSQVSKTFGDASFINPLTNTSGGATTYSSSNLSVATVNSTTGEVTIVGVGTATISVNVAQTQSYSACSASYTLTVSAGELNPSVAYSTHIQNLGWNQGTMRDGEMAGTSGLAYRLEGIKISLESFEGVSGGIEYCTHVENLGWQSYVADGTMSGTTGMAYRLEAINIRLTGDIANYYDVYYRVHAENIGWMGWAKNDEKAGTAGYSYRLEAIQIVLVEKGGAAPTDVKDIKSVVDYAFTSASDGPSSPYRDELVSYNTHVENIGWQEYSKAGSVAGTSGLAYRLEGIHIQLGGAAAALDGSIEYTTHVQNKGWLSYVADGKMSGTSGEALRLEAIQIRLTDEVEEAYDVYYRVHAQNFGWMGWAKNDEQAGTAGYAYRLEAIQIVLVAKGGEAPGATYGGITSSVSKAFIKA